jgi:hypothetical protein
VVGLWLVKRFITYLKINNKTKLMSDVFPYYRLAVAYIIKNQSTDGLLEELEDYFLPPPLMVSSVFMKWSELAKNLKASKELNLKDYLKKTPNFKRASTLRKSHYQVADLCVMSSHFDPEMASITFAGWTNCLYTPDEWKCYMHYFFDKNTINNPLKFEAFIKSLRDQDSSYLGYLACAMGQTSVAMSYYGFSNEVDSKAIINTIANLSYLKFLEIARYGNHDRFSAQSAAYWANSSLNALKQSTTIVTDEKDVIKLLKKLEMAPGVATRQLRENLEGDIVNAESGDSIKAV